MPHDVPQTERTDRAAFQPGTEAIVGQTMSSYPVTGNSRGRLRPGDTVTVLRVSTYPFRNGHAHVTVRKTFPDGYTAEYVFWSNELTLKGDA